MPAAVQPLRPAPPRSPEREHLAAAIERRTRAADHLGRITAAKPNAWSRVFENERAVEAAEEALRHARADEPRRLAAHAIGEDVGAVDDVATATAAAATASEALDLARKIIRALEERERDAQADLDAAAASVRKAARAVLAAALAPLASEFDAAQQRIATITAIAMNLPAGSYPGRVDVWPSADTGLGEARAWMAAIEPLEHDPDAPLPGDAPPAAA